MKILHVTPWYEPAWGYGGPIVSIPALCEALASAGHEVHVRTTTADGARELPAGTRDVRGVRVTHFPRWTGDHTHASPALLASLARDARRFDVLHVHTWWNLVAMPALATCLAAGVRPVCSPRGMLSAFSFARGPRTRRTFHATIGRPMLERAMLHTTSRGEDDATRAACPGATPRILPNFVRLPGGPRAERPAPEPPCAERPFRLVSLSRVHPIKRIDALLDGLAATHVPWTLTVAGGGDASYVATLHARARDLGVAERVRWLGEVTGDAKFDLLAEADAFALVSETESFSNAVVEALSVGTPALVTPGVGLADLVARHGVGWVAPREDLARALGHAAVDLDVRRRASHEGPALARREFASGALTTRYVELYAAAAACGQTGVARATDAESRT